MSAKILPFPRGSTLFAESTPADDDAKNIIGQCYEVPDVTWGGGQPIILRAVQNASGGALTTAQRCLSFTAGTVDEWGTKVDGLAATGGELAKPLDDYYDGKISTIAEHDVLYVVDRGLCDILTTSGTNGLVAQATQVQMMAEGMVGLAATDDVSIGTLVEPTANLPGTATSAPVTVFVHGGLNTTRTDS